MPLRQIIRGSNYSCNLERPTVITLAIFEKSHLKEIRKKNKSPVRSFPGSKSKDAFELLFGGYHWIEKRWAKCPQRLRTQVFAS